MRFAPERRSAEIIYPRQFRTPAAVLAGASNRTQTDNHALDAILLTTPARRVGKSMAVDEWARVHRTLAAWGGAPTHFLAAAAGQLSPIVQPLPPPRSTLRALIRQLAARIASEAGL